MRVVNPLTNEKMSKKASELVINAREVRSEARKRARSGHPGRRAEALRVLSNVPTYIKNVYGADAVGIDATTEETV